MKCPQCGKSHSSETKLCQETKRGLKDEESMAKILSELDPQSGNKTEAEQYVDRRFEYSEMGEIDSAMKAFRKAMQLDPKCANAFYWRGYIKHRRSMRKPYMIILNISS